MADLISYLLDGQFRSCSTPAGDPDGNETIVLTSPSSFYTLTLNSWNGTVDWSGSLTLGTTRGFPSAGITDWRLWYTEVNTLPAYNTNVVVIMQADGNLCVYYGTDPDHKQSPAFWCAGNAPGAGQYHLALHDDGLLAIYTGHELGQGMQIWTSGKVDSVATFAWTEPDHDFRSATIEELDPVELYSDTLENNTDAPAQVIVKGQEDAPEISEWTETQIVADMSNVKIPPFSAMAPRIVAGKFVAGDTSLTVNMNEENESGRTWQWYETVTVPAESELDVTVTVQMAKVTVPFFATALITYQSGQETFVHYQGVFTGIISHDMQFTTSAPQ